jgi:GNAT superfamily N-acetyltransferase
MLAANTCRRTVEPDFLAVPSPPGRPKPIIAVGDRFVGRGLAAQFLDWAADLAARRGKRFLRLDTDALRPKVCEFYRRQGFHRVGTKDTVGLTYALFERPL